MENEYILKNNEIIGVKGEKTIEFYYLNNITVLITKEKEYFNVYFLDDRIKREPLNNLNEQIPLNNKPKNWEYYLDLRTIEWNLWFKYNKQFIITYKEIEE